MRKLAIIGGALLAVGIARAEAPFKDVPKKHWAYEAIQTLTRTGLIRGENKKFDGQKAFTRYEMAVVLARYVEKLADAKTSIQGSLEKTYPLIKKLATEFSGELDLLGVKQQDLLARVTSLETRVDVHDQQMSDLRAMVEANRQAIAALQAGYLPEVPGRRAPPPPAPVDPQAPRVRHPEPYPPIYRTVPPPGPQARRPEPMPPPAYAPAYAQAPAMAYAPAPAPAYGAAPGAELFAAPAAGGEADDALRLHQLRARARSLIDQTRPRGRRPAAPTAVAARPTPSANPALSKARVTEAELLEAIDRVRRGEMDVAEAERIGREAEAELASVPGGGSSGSVVYPVEGELFGSMGFGPPAGD